MKERDTILDIAKGIGIVCVVLGHSFYSELLPRRMIFCFHMPLFFLVSGMLFNPDKCGSFFDVFKKALRNLLVPYVLFALIDIAVIAPNKEYLFSLSPLPLSGQILRGYGGPALWFLMAMASVQLFAYVVNGFLSNCLTARISRWGGVKLCILILLALIGQTLWTFSDAEGVNGKIIHVVSRLPLGIMNIPCCGFFFLLGMWGNDMIRDWLHQSSKRQLCAVLAIGIAALFAWCSVFDVKWNLRVCRFGFAMLPPCAAGLAAVFATSMIVSDYKWKLVGNPLAFIGQNSLCFFALEFPVAYIVERTFAGFGVHLPYMMYQTPNPVWAVAFRTVLVLCILFLVAPLMSHIIACAKRKVAIQN